MVFGGTRVTWLLILLGRLLTRPLPSQHLLNQSRESQAMETQRLTASHG